MRRLLSLLAGLAILALFPLAATVSARVSDEGGGKVVQTAGTSGTAGTSSGSSSGSANSDSNELSGTLSVSGSTATVTAADGTVLSCAIPAGTDLTAFVGQQVEMECENGTLTEVKNLATGEEIQPGDDNGDDNPCATAPTASGSDDEGDDDNDECDPGSSGSNDDPGDDDSGDDGSGGGGGDDGGGDD